MTMRKIFIFSAGDGSREVLRIIREINKDKLIWDVLGFVDTNPKLIGKQVDGCMVYSAKGLSVPEGSSGICGVMNPNLRKKITEKEIEAKGIKLASIVHPAFKGPDDFIIKPGAIIYPSVNISFNVRLGKCVSLLYNVMLGHDTDIGDYASIMPSATVNGNCIVKDSCIIGSGAILSQGITIGRNTVIGIGTTVFADVKENQSVVDLARKITSNRWEAKC